MVTLKVLNKLLQKRGGTLITVNVGEPVEKVKDFCVVRGIQFPVLLDHSGKVSDQYGITGIPATYLVDLDGFLLGKATGAREWDSDAAIKLIKELLGISEKSVLAVR